MLMWLVVSLHKLFVLAKLSFAAAVCVCVCVCVGWSYPRISLVPRHSLEVASADIFAGSTCMPSELRR